MSVGFLAVWNEWFCVTVVVSFSKFATNKCSKMCTYAVGKLDGIIVGPL